MHPSRAWIVCAPLLVVVAACKGPNTPEPTADPGSRSAAETVAVVADAAVGKPVIASCPPNELYAADGLESLVDGRMGSDMYEDVEWMGWWYEDKPFDVTIDLGQPTRIRELGVHALTSSESWILFPRKIEFEISDDGETFEPLAKIEPSKEDLENEYPETKIFKASDLSAKARFVRVRAQRYGELPEGHPGYGGADGHEGQAWLFIDEILVNPKSK